MAQKIPHFYCHKCKAYELKTSPHFRAQKQRFSRRRKKEKKSTEGRQTALGGSSSDSDAEARAGKLIIP